jgi:Raf kinase inhibitor-like YbhB/YbcL family protein
MRKGAAWLMLACVVLGGCAQPRQSTLGGTAAMLTVRSSAFGDGGEIPSRYTCDGQDVSPPLAWSGAPSEAASVAVIASDPDAGEFVHWLAADVVTSSGLGEGASGASAGMEGRNGFGKVGYGGPCPPSGSHRYTFTVYALSAALGLAAGFSRDDLERAMEGKVLASGSLTARYRRQG